MSSFAKFSLKIRRAIPSPGRLLASWQLSVVLMVLGALYYALLAIWSTMSTKVMVGNIAGLVPFWALYAMLLLNTVLCLWQRLGGLRRNLAQTASLDRDRKPRWEREARPEIDRGAARLMLRRAGYRAKIRDDGGLWGIRSRWAPLGPFVFHGAFLLIATAFILSMVYRSEETIRVAVGERFVNATGQTLTAGRTVPKDLRFEVLDITPAFWGDKLLFTELKSTLLLGNKKVVTQINRPLWLGWGSFLRLSGFGYTPRYELVDTKQKREASSFVKMDIFPPGRHDSMRPGGYPHRVYLEVFPDLVVSKDGKASTKSLNLKNPGLKVMVYRGKVFLGTKLLRLNESMTYEGMKLSFPEIRYWGEYSLVNDPGAPLLFLSFLLAVFGLLLKLRGGRSEIVWRPGVLMGWGEAEPVAAMVVADGQEDTDGKEDADGQEDTDGEADGEKSVDADEEDAK